MKTFKFISQIVIVIFVTLVFVACHQDDDEVIQTELITEDDTVNIESLDSEIQEFLTNIITTETENNGRNIFDPNILEIGVRNGSQGSFRRVGTDPITCFRPNTSYEVLLTMPSSGPQTKSCACLTINRNGAIGTSSARQCRDTRTITIPIPFSNTISFNYILYDVQTSNSGRFNFTAIAGCGGNTPVSSFSNSTSGLRGLGVSISNFSFCL